MSAEELLTSAPVLTVAASCGAFVCTAEVHCSHLMCAEGVQFGSLRAELVLMEPITGAGLANGAALQGKVRWARRNHPLNALQVALCEHGGISVPAKARLALKYGAVGLIVLPSQGTNPQAWDEVLLEDTVVQASWFALPVLVVKNMGGGTLIRSWVARGTVEAHLVVAHLLGWSESVRRLQSTLWPRPPWS